jgi:hypothetical protein
MSPDPELERQIERASLFTHSALGRSATHVREMETFLYGLVDVLLAKRVVTAEEVGAAVERVEHALKPEIREPGVALRIDEDAGEPAPPVVVDCAARLHLCHAACCRLDFALSADEVERGAVRWDLGRPYMIRHDATGSCVHNDPGDATCSIYADRPGTCRRYSCANDQRIWTDFEGMQPNTAWLAENLGADGPRVLHAMLQTS